MFRAIAIAACAGFACAGCANDTLPPPGALNVQSLSLLTGSQSNVSTGSLGDAGTTAPQNVDLANDKTMAGRVLTAIALERVTGRKPDPATLSTLY